ARKRQHQPGASLALLADDPAEASFLRERLLDTALEPEEMLLLRDALAPHGRRLAPGLWAEVDAAGVSAGRRFRALIALAAFDPEGPHWPRCGEKAAERLLASDPVHLGDWAAALLPVRDNLLPPLLKAFRGRNPSERRVAATVLREYADRPRLLADLLADADESQFGLLLPRLREHAGEAVPELE